MERHILETVEGNAPECPRCGHWNAMLDRRDGERGTVFYCRDCGYEVVAEGTVLLTKAADAPGMGSRTTYHTVREVVLDRNGNEYRGYYAEVRVFDEDGDDYVNDIAEGNTFIEALTDAVYIARQLGGRVTIDVYEMTMDPINEGSTCVWSETHRGWKTFTVMKKDGSTYINSLPAERERQIWARYARGRTVHLREIIKMEVTE